MTILTAARQKMVTMVFALWVIGLTNLSAQTASPKATTQQKAAHVPAEPSGSQGASGQPALERTAVQPSASPVARWPSRQPSGQARVRWDSRGLEIEASNSSLNAILQQVAAQTGAKLEGLSEDQRVFGSYGPGPGLEVLLKLLDGSGYNVLMIGGRGGEAPLKIVLSTRVPIGARAVANNRNRGVSEEPAAPKPEVQAESPSEPVDPFAQGGPRRDPVEFMEEILNRQHKIDLEQEQQSKQNNSQN